MRPQVGQLVNNKYRLLRLIGDGGMGSVFEARHEALGTTVALKFLHSELTRRPGLVQRFLQEARVVARMESPHVVRVSDVDQTPDGLAFIVMEYIEGKSLQALYEELYRGGKRLTMAEAIGFALQMLDGLETAHSAGIVHRDLKPDNVMITKGAKGSSLLKILDFGIAKLKVEGEHMKGLTRPGVVMGTPEYMAPEQAFSADQVDARADIFAFGVMFFEMLAGRRPVGGDEPHQIAAQYLAGEVAKLTDLAPTVPPGLAEVVHKAMAAQAKDRWANVTELRHAIEPFVPASRSSSTVKSDRPATAASVALVAPAAIAAAALAPPPQLAANVAPAAGARSVPKTDPGEVDGGATEKSDGLPGMMVGGGTAEGLGPGGPPYPPGLGAAAQSPALAISPVAPSPPPAMTDPSSPEIGIVGHGGGWAGTEPSEFRPFEASYTATEGFEPLAMRPGGTDVGAPRVGGTAVDPAAPLVGSPPATPVGGYAASAQPPVRRKKSGGLVWALFVLTTLTGAVLGAVFLWDRLQLDDGPDPKPIATGAPVLTQVPAERPAPPPLATTPPAAPPPPAAPTQPKPPPTQPKPPPTQPKPPPTQPAPPPTIPTVLPWQTPTVPPELPPIFPQRPAPAPTNPKPAPSVEPTKPRPTFELPKFRPRPSNSAPPGGSSTPPSKPKPAPSGSSSRPKLKVPHKN